MADKLTDSLENQKGLLKDMTDQSGRLYDALTSIGTEIAAAIEDAVDGATDLNDIGKTIANTYGKEITNSLKKQAKSLEGNIKLQIQINKGQNASKEIEKAIDANLARKQVTLMHIENLHKNTGKLTVDQAHLQAKLTNEAIDTFKTQEGILNQTKKDNVEKQKSLSIFKIAGDALGGMADKIDKSGTLSGILEGNFKDVVTTARIGQLTIASLVNFMIKGIKELDELQTGYNKKFGLTDAHAINLQSRMSNIAAASGKTSINFRDVNKALQSIGETTGILATGLEDDVLGGAAKLQKLLGLSNKGMTMLAFNAQVTGQSMDDQTNSILSGVHATESKLGFHMQERTIIQEVSELHGLIRANLGRNVEAMGEIVAEAKAFGMTLQDLAGISANLLNFQSSIEAELTAELFTGKQLNLEKARLYALTGDYKGLMGEIINQMGSEHEFLTMNVLAKQQYAAALGMSVDQMSDLIFAEGNLAKLKADATAAEDQDTLNMLEQRTIAESMADIMTKVQTTFISIAEGPIGHLASGLSTILEHTYALSTILGMVAGIKLYGLIGQFMMLASSSSSAAIASMAAAFIANPIAGMAIALGVGAIGGLVANSIFKSQKSIKPPKITRHQNLGAEEMVTIDKGSAIFDAGESVIRTENFGKMNDTLAMIHQAILGQKLKVNVQSHHGTRYV